MRGKRYRSAASKDVAYFKTINDVNCKIITTYADLICTAAITESAESFMAEIAKAKVNGFIMVPDILYDNIASDLVDIAVDSTYAGTQNPYGNHTMCYAGNTDYITSEFCEEPVQVVDYIILHKQGNGSSFFLISKSALAKLGFRPRTPEDPMPKLVTYRIKPSVWNAAIEDGVGFKDKWSVEDNLSDIDGLSDIQIARISNVKFDIQGKFVKAENVQVTNRKFKAEYYSTSNPTFRLKPKFEITSDGELKTLTLSTNWDEMSDTSDSMISVIKTSNIYQADLLVIFETFDDVPTEIVVE